MGEIGKKRKKIDLLDRQILDLLKERLSTAEEIGKIKKDMGKEIVDDERERLIYKKLEMLSDEYGLDARSIRRIFFEIISMGRSRQKDAQKEVPASDYDGKILFQGEPGAYSEAALLKAFPKAEPIPKKSFHGVFEALESGEAEVALLPIENSTEGSVSPVYDLLGSTDAKAFQEVFLRIEHCLLSTGSGEKKRVYSHPQALEQCRTYIVKNRLEPVPFYDTAGAARHISMDDEDGSCAIASALAAEHYGLEVTDSNIEDNPNNTTRFLALSRNARCKYEPSGRYKTSLIFAIRHEPGSLFNSLKAFSDEGINMTKIESRPTKSTPWEYLFFLDIEGHLDSAPVKRAVARLLENTIFLKDIGSYKRGD
jgi:prephenate dehydratase